MLLQQLSFGNLTLKSNIFIAPLAGYTNLPTRNFFRHQGAGIAYAEMVSAEGLHHNRDKSISLIKTDNADVPLGIQLFGKNDERILQAYRVIANEKFDVIDLNCGCSVKKVIRAESGAFLLKNPEGIYKILKALKNETDKPVTLKIRSGYDSSSINYFEVAQAAETAGADLITFHPRTRAMLFNGHADWSQIKSLKEKSTIPVIGNGDIFTGEDAVRMMEETGCDGVMLARGLIENPFLTEEVSASLSGTPYTPPTLERRIQALLSGCKSIVELYGETKGILEYRKYFRGYLKGYSGVSALRQKVNRIEDYDNFRKAIEEYYDEYQRKS